jgi:NADPH2 dehydrogenase
LAYLHLVESRVAGNVDVEDERAEKETLDFAVEAWGSKSPVLFAGGYSPDSTRRAVKEYAKRGQEVTVVFGRHYIANPDLPYRILKGLELRPVDVL